MLGERLHRFVTRHAKKLVRVGLSFAFLSALREVADVERQANGHPTSADYMALVAILIGRVDAADDKVGDFARAHKGIAGIVLRHARRLAGRHASCY